MLLMVHGDQQQQISHQTYLQSQTECIETFSCGHRRHLLVKNEKALVFSFCQFQYENHLHL